MSPPRARKPSLNVWRLVFIDETTVTTKMTTLRPRSARRAAGREGHTAIGRH
jgi:hypothetical protein